MQYTIPQPYLGEVFAFTINTPDLETSSQFYQKLGFKEIMRGDFPFPFIQLSDDAILIMLKKDNEPYLALTYYVKDIEKIITELEGKGIQFVSKPQKGDKVKKCLLQSPDKANVSLVEIAGLFARPKGRTMISMDQSEYIQPETYTNQVVGMYGEFAEAVADLETSIAFWEKLGFNTLMKFDAPGPWAILSDGSSIVGLHQGNEFSSATITFFAADMESKLNNLKAQGLSFKEMGPANGVLTTPEQQKLFLFNMGA